MAVAGVMFYKGVLRHQRWFRSVLPLPRDNKSSLSDQDQLLELHEVSSSNISSSIATIPLIDSASCARIVGMCEDDESSKDEHIGYQSRPLQTSNAIADDYLIGPHIETQFDTMEDSRHLRGRFLIIPVDASVDEQVSPTRKVGRFEVSCSPTGSVGPFSDAAAVGVDQASMSDDGYGSLESRKDKVL
jgi:hypothetical protein